MAKIYGINGVLTGKQSNQVFAVSGGVQTVRAYQPVVYNPNTPSQIAARAKLKLASQLAAIMGPYIAMPKVGNVSSRNNFIKKNYGSLGYASNEATVNLTQIQLTNSVVGFPGIQASIATGIVTVSNVTSVLGINRVVVLVFTRDEDQKLRFGGSVVTVPSEEGLFTANVVTGAQRESYVYVYGVRDNTEAAAIIFGNLVVPTAETIAKLVVSRRLTDADITLTETRSLKVTPQS